MQFSSSTIRFGAHNTFSTQNRQQKNPALPTFGSLSTDTDQVRFGNASDINTNDSDAAEAKTLIQEMANNPDEVEYDSYREGSAGDPEGYTTTIGGRYKGQSFTLQTHLGNTYVLPFEFSLQKGNGETKVYNAKYHSNKERDVTANLDDLKNKAFHILGSQNKLDTGYGQRAYLTSLAKKTFDKKLVWQKEKSVTDTEWGKHHTYTYTTVLPDQAEVRLVDHQISHRPWDTVSLEVIKPDKTVIKLPLTGSDARGGLTKLAKTIDLQEKAKTVLQSITTNIASMRATLDEVATMDEVNVSNDLDKTVSALEKVQSLITDTLNGEPEEISKKTREIKRELYE